MSPAMPRHAQSGQANLTTILLLLGLVVSGVWVWKRLSPDMQDLIIDQALPLAALSLAIMAVAWILIGKIVKRRRRNQQRARLIKLFESQTASDKRLTLAFAVIEVNEYRRVGLEVDRVAAPGIICDDPQAGVGRQTTSGTGNGGKPPGSDRRRRGCGPSPGGLGR
jgi:hypothetical protein